MRVNTHPRHDGSSFIRQLVNKAITASRDNKISCKCERKKNDLPIFLMSVFFFLWLFIISQIYIWNKSSGLLKVFNDRNCSKQFLVNTKGGTVALNKTEPVCCFQWWSHSLNAAQLFSKCCGFIFVALPHYFLHYPQCFWEFIRREHNNNKDNEK